MCSCAGQMGHGRSAPASRTVRHCAVSTIWTRTVRGFCADSPPAHSEIESCLLMMIHYGLNVKSWIIILILGCYSLYFVRPPRKILKATTSKIKKAISSKRQRDGDDSDDEDYAPNPSDMAAASSVGGVGDDSSEEDIEGEEDDITDLMGLNLPSRQWTVESYSNARSINQFHQQNDKNILNFTTQVQQDAYFGHMVKK